MNKCPNCNHKLYGEKGHKRYCKHCGYSHNPKFLEEKWQEEQNPGNKE